MSDTPIALTSSSGNHSSTKWATATAQMVIDIRDVAEDRMMSAIALQQSTMIVLTKYYDRVIRREIECLQSYVDQCDTEYDVADADKAVIDIQHIAEGSLWHPLIQSNAWIEAAGDIIRNHLSTAIHVERLLWCDANPTQPSAIAYRART